MTKQERETVLRERAQIYGAVRAASAAIAFAGRTMTHSKVARVLDAEERAELLRLQQALDRFALDLS